MLSFLRCLNVTIVRVGPLLSAVKSLDCIKFTITIYCNAQYFINALQHLFNSVQYLFILPTGICCLGADWNWPHWSTPKNVPRLSVYFDSNWLFFKVSGGLPSKKVCSGSSKKNLRTLILTWLSPEHTLRLRTEVCKWSKLCC